MPAAAVAALAIVGLLGAGLGVWPGAGGTRIAPVTLGWDGIPNQIDGQRVYRTADQAEWQDLSGCFLVGGWPDFYAMGYFPGAFSSGGTATTRPACPEVVATVGAPAPTCYLGPRCS